MNDVESATNIMVSYHILVVDDEENIRVILQQFLEGLNYRVTTAPNGEEALNVLESVAVDLIITDFHMPALDGIELLKILCRRFPSIPVIIITGMPKVDAAVECIKIGAADYISKPFDLNDLQYRTESVLATVEEQARVVDQTDIYTNHGRVLAGYKVIDTLAEGSIGLVFLAEKEGQRFALKVLKFNDISDEKRSGLLPRFMREAKAAAAVEHPNVVQFIEYGLAKEEKIPYLVTEYIPGRSLKSIIDHGTLLSFDQKISIIRQIALALTAIHAANICHRDVKPSNILLTDDFQVKLTDFGVAHLPNSDLTLTHNILGSPSYMSPEAFVTAKVDERADIFSLGVITYELLVGEKPFREKNFILLGQKVTNAKPREPRKLAPNIPLEVQDIMAKMLKKTADHRYTSAADVVAALDSMTERGGMSLFGRVRDLARTVVSHDWS